MLLLLEVKKFFNVLFEIRKVSIEIRLCCESKNEKNEIEKFDKLKLEISKFAFAIQNIVKNDLFSNERFIEQF